MAYKDYAIQVPLLVSGSRKVLCSASGERTPNRFSPGLSPVYLRGVAAIPLTTVAIVKKVKHSINLVTGGNGKATTTGDSIGTITVASGANQGKAYYRTNINKTVKVGMEITDYVLTKATQACAHTVVLFIEPSWEEPKNNTKMVLVTA